MGVDKSDYWDFTCDICGEGSQGCYIADGPENHGMYECEHEHHFCKSHMEKSFDMEDFDMEDLDAFLAASKASKDRDAILSGYDDIKKESLGESDPDDYIKEQKMNMLLEYNVFETIPEQYCPVCYSSAVALALKNVKTTRKFFKKPTFRTIQISPFFQDGKIEWCHGDSDYGKSRISSDYSPGSTEVMSEIFEDYMKYLVVAMFSGDVEDDGQYADWTLKEVVEFAEKLKEKEK